MHASKYPSIPKQQCSLAHMVYYTSCTVEWGIPNSIDTHNVQACSNKSMRAPARGCGACATTRRGTARSARWSCPVRRALHRARVPPGWCCARAPPSLPAVVLLAAREAAHAQGPTGQLPAGALTGGPRGQDARGHRGARRSVTVRLARVAIGLCKIRKFNVNVCTVYARQGGSIKF